MNDVTRDQPEISLVAVGCTSVFISWFRMCDDFPYLKEEVPCAL